MAEWSKEPKPTMSMCIRATLFPISQMSRAAEIDMREMLGETDLPAALLPKNNIIL